MKRFIIVLLLVLGVSSLSFTGGVHEASSQKRTQDTVSSDCHGWSYYPRTGPASWATLFPEADCGKAQQSPVNFINSTPRTEPAIKLDYGSSELKVIREHYAVHVNYDKGSSITYDGTTYDLKQFHFHLPGEHRISNQRYVMEMHLVHKTPDGHTAVIGVLFDVQGPENRAYKPIVDNLPPPGSEVGGSRGMIDALSLLPANRRYYRYTGSLTTPCCTQGVEWLVLADRVKISSLQLKKFQRSQEGKRNDRPVQRSIQADR